MSKLRTCVSILWVLILVLAWTSGCGSHHGWKLSRGIYILDKDSPVETFAELKARLPAKAIYVDRWATWCGPCLEEFAYYDSLRPFLEANEIEILYLNSDMEIEESQWFDFIREHQLVGYHVRLNQKLQRDLIDERAFVPRIPQFMIMDSTGRVLEKQALKPSSGKALQNQLTEVLDLTE
jgi:thiol-disulfide isomerase/thioredoxin